MTEKLLSMLKSHCGECDHRKTEHDAEIGCLECMAETPHMFKPIKRKGRPPAPPAKSSEVKKLRKELMQTKRKLQKVQEDLIAFRRDIEARVFAMENTTPFELLEEGS